MAPGAPSDSASVASASVRAWTRVVAQLAPIIGPRGVDSLFRRSIQLAQGEFPWLAAGPEAPDGAFPAEAFADCLAARDPDAAAEASVELLAAFAELLETLVGPGLARRLLDPVWRVPSPPASKESAP
ncbi:hypothetical protein [Geothrix sp. 21YS21S-2]|uniref:hypothetical protein n=1 Tax=Geothrix sp. 21YS21S-2 TaxID=3068893 RepID=UPI0027B8DA3E|nr:hypothetical protein [Geothrix sp. 21YS21S-2]